MRTSVVRASVLGLILSAALATPALAHVHGVSNAECAAPGAPSGATSEGSRNAPGRPDAPIPFNASGGKSDASRAQEADAQGTNCD
jgi:hypothetical protein